MNQAEPSAQRLLVVAGLIWCEGRLLLQRRAESASHGAGMLEFPGGKIEPGESAQQALRRELIEEWGPAARDLVVQEIETVLHHVYPAPGPEVHLLIYRVDAPAWRAANWKALARAEVGAQLVDYAVDELPVDEFLAADRVFVERLKSIG